LEKLPRDSYTANHYQAIQAQLGVLMGEMQAKQSGILGQAVGQMFTGQLGREQKHWSTLEEVFGQKALAEQLKAFTPLIPQRTVKALVMTQDIAIKGFSDKLTQTTRMTLAQSVTQGEGIEAGIKRLKRVKDMPKNRQQLQLITRMETARASNEAKSEF